MNSEEIRRDLELDEVLSSTGNVDELEQYLQGDMTGPSGIITGKKQEVDTSVV